MILYQRRTIAPAADVGQPGPLPQMLVGLSDVSLANLSAALHPDVVATFNLGNTGFVPVVVPDVPTVIRQAQFIMALKNANKLGAARAAINGLPADDPLQIFFQYTDPIRRDDPHVEQLRVLLSVGNALVDALFIDAAAQLFQS